MKSVWRMLRAPFTARSGRAFVYCFCQPFLTAGSIVVVAVAIALSLAGAGIPALVLLPPVLGFARLSGGGFRATANGLLDANIAAPVRAPRRPGFLGFIVRHFAEPIAWRSIAHMALKPLLLILEFLFGVGFRLLLPMTVSGYFQPGGQHASQVKFMIFAAVLFWAAPSLTELLLQLDVLLMRRLLGPTEDSLRIRELEQTRSHAINEASATLRRIERDLHDGAQARLVALGIRLGRAERLLEKGRTEAGLELLRESRAETKQVIGDLRDLVRGIHPPALDSGLEPALTTLAALTPIPTTVRTALPVRLSSAAETMLYFAAAELLTNAGKHSGANSVAISVFGDSHGSARLVVTDDGRGGANAQGEGSGLRGLSERVRGLDGHVSVTSPLGGPTTVMVELPAQDVSDAVPEMRR
ncbi:sensor histidine kinase [Actinospica robiniae]|uniref:sensor histidine kinase n=1 Tax=Actinospica robiniae TaxID=304901 RepID=UPI00068488F8|nr:histidine kinase [Actinospica robiniae]